MKTLAHSGAEINDYTIYVNCKVTNRIITTFYFFMIITLHLSQCPSQPPLMKINFPYNKNGNPLRLNRKIHTKFTSLLTVNPC